MVDLHIVTKVENVGTLTNDINVLLQVENGVFMVVCGWVIWDAPPAGWARIPIVVYDIEQWTGAGDFFVSARVYDTVTPGTKIQDLVQDSTIMGGLYNGFTTLGNLIDSANASFTVAGLLNMKITEHTASVS